MLFNSIDFLLFFPAVVILYWILPEKWKNPFLLIASYFFYMNWQPVFALLILFTSFTTWGCSLLLGSAAPKHLFNNITLWRKTIVGICLTINFVILFIFKYAGFFTRTIHDALQFLHIAMPMPDFELLLPVGISFYTFQAIGYIIDVYRGTITAERNFFTYALFVSFFPQLVAGPIERAKNLLPQFHERHKFNGDDIIYGLRLMVVGYFMKLCIADSVSPYVDAVYAHLQHHSGISVLLATFFFTFQILCDFGGYSLIAIGTARCVGFRLMQNFRQPYLATNVKDFWRRWHISLSSWFSDYLYIPLGGNRCKPLRHRSNLFVTFLVSGLWHGANMTFVVWGAYHGLLQIAYTFTGHKKKQEEEGGMGKTSVIKVGLAMALTFILTMIGWVFFRAETLSDAWLALTKMARPTGSLFTGAGLPSILLSLLLIGILMIMEVYNERKKEMGCASIPATDETSSFRWTPSKIGSVVFTAFLLIVILLCAEFNGGQFIYFQF